MNVGVGGVMGGISTEMRTIVQCIVRQNMTTKIQSRASQFAGLAGGTLFIEDTGTTTMIMNLMWVR